MEGFIRFQNPNFSNLALPITTAAVEPGNSRGLDSTTVVTAEIRGISDPQCVVVIGKSGRRTHYMCVGCLVAV